MDKKQARIEITRSRTSTLSEEEIERIHKAFIETDGCVYRIAQCTGFARSTISKYAKKGGWHKNLPHNNAKDIIQKEGEKVEGEIMPRLRILRELLFEEIMGDDKTETDSDCSLRIPPKTLAEAVKALIDVDKRVTERKGTQPTEISDIYQGILERCARIIKDKSGRVHD